MDAAIECATTDQIQWLAQSDAEISELLTDE